MKAILTFLFFSLPLSQLKSYNLSLGTSCAFSHHCNSGCCEMGFDPQKDPEGKNQVLGFYCQPKDYCTAGNLRNIGQSCKISNECNSQCCEDTVCQANSLCFSKYILPFVIVFGILGLFLVAAIIIVIVHKCRKNQWIEKVRHQQKIDQLRRAQQQ